MLEQVVGKLDRKPIALVSTRGLELEGELPADRSGTRRWQAHLTWEGLQSVRLQLTLATARGSSRVALIQNFAHNLPDEPEPAIGSESAIVSNWLEGFDDSAFDPEVRERVDRAAASNAALLWAAAYAFDPDWWMLRWSPGRGRVPSVLSLDSPKRPSDSFSDRPDQNGAFSQKLVQSFTDLDDPTMHVSCDPCSPPPNPEIIIGQAPTAHFYPGAELNAVELLRRLALLPDGACLMAPPP